jgi:hypothetical protein
VHETALRQIRPQQKGHSNSVPGPNCKPHLGHSVSLERTMRPHLKQLRNMSLRASSIMSGMALPII